MLTYPIILGSRSPRRLELLQLLVPRDRIVVLPPASPDEVGFDDLHDEAAIAGRLVDIVQTKRRDVDRQLTAVQRADFVGLVADTIIVVSDGEESRTVLGQPPESSDWQETVRRWFEQYYSGRTHAAWTGICAWNSAGTLHEEIVATSVTFRSMTAEEIDWYVSTGEPRGKAGGYALQGIASLFVARVAGSLTNVVGLPLEAVRTALQKMEARSER